MRFQLALLASETEGFCEVKVAAALGIRNDDLNFKKQFRDLNKAIFFGQYHGMYALLHNSNPFEPVEDTPKAHIEVFKVLLENFFQGSLKIEKKVLIDRLIDNTILVGSPRNNTAARYILGMGGISPLLKTELPVRFVCHLDDPFRRQTLLVENRTIEKEHLVITCLPMGSGGLRLINIAGLTAFGTMAIDLLLRREDILVPMYNSTSALTAWQFVAEVKTDEINGMPIDIGQWRVFEIKSADFEAFNNLIDDNSLLLDDPINLQLAVVEAARNGYKVEMMGGPSGRPSPPKTTYPISAKVNSTGINFFRAVFNELSPEMLAQLVRKELVGELTDTAIDILPIANKLDVHLLEMKLGADKPRYDSLYVRDEDTSIYINEDLSNEWKRWFIAEELYNLLNPEQRTFRMPESEDELEARLQTERYNLRKTRFAEELLISSEILADYRNKLGTLALAMLFNVPVLKMQSRLTRLESRDRFSYAKTEETTASRGNAGSPVKFVDTEPRRETQFFRRLKSRLFDRAP